MARPFRFGVQAYSAPTPQAWRDLAKKAEDLGYSAFHLADHYIGPGPMLAKTNHPVQDIAATVAMAVAAEATSTIRIGCRVFCVDYHHPVVLAKNAATLDFFSEGRLELGLGAGWLGGEYEAMGIPLARPGVRIRKLAEYIEAIRQQFGDGEVKYHGEHVHIEGFEGLPKPGRHVPIMIGGGSPKVLALAGREADIVSLNFDNSSGMIGPGIPRSTAEFTASKIDWIRDGAGDRFDQIEIEIGAYFTVVTDQGAATTEQMSKMFGLTPEQMAAFPHALIGSVDELCDIIEQRRDQYGISYVTVGGPNVEAFAPVVARLAGT